MSEGEANLPGPSAPDSTGRVPQLGQQAAQGHRVSLVRTLRGSAICHPLIRLSLPLDMQK